MSTPHEAGHHVQRLTGKLDELHGLQQRSDEREANRLSVALELQADFYDSARISIR